jgi:1,2-diacylglycerol 3-alpha-glucosyltransferase
MKTDKIKILYVADTFAPKKDGVVRFMLETSSRLSDKFEVNFLAPRLEGAETAARTMNLNVAFVPIRRFQISNYPLAHPNSKVIHQAVEENDIIFINSIAFLGLAALKHAKKLKKPIIEFVHSIDWELFAYATKFPDKYAGTLKPLVIRQYKKCNLLIVANKGMRTLLKSLKIKIPIGVLPLGVDQKKFYFDRIKRVYVRRELGLTNNFVIGFHGRLSKEKNIELLVKSFEIFKKRVPQARLLILGDGIEKRCLDKSGVISKGFVNNPQDYLQAMDVYVLPSQTETSALSLMEAMSCGLPCIATNVGAIPSYLKNNRNGILLNKDDLKPELVALAINKFFVDIRFRNNIKQNAAKTIECCYSWDKTTKELERYFLKLIK